MELSDEEVLAECTDASESDEPDEDYGGDSRNLKNLEGRPIPLHESDSEATADLEEGEEDIGGWGTSKRDYYNADTIETEADALEEEAEARRLQQKQLQGLTEEDFGFDEVDWLEANKPGADDANDAERDHSTLKILPALEITDALGSEERLKIMKTRYPEFEPLAKEFVELQVVHKDLKLVAEAATAVNPHLRARNDENGFISPKAPIAVMKQSALSAYLAALCMYFALLTSGNIEKSGKTTAIPPAELREHSIMGTLVQCRELWAKVKNTPIPETNTLTNGIPNPSNEDISSKEENKILDGGGKTDNKRQTKVEAQNPRRTKAQKAEALAAAEAETDRLERLKKTEQDLLSLSALIPTSSKLQKASLHPPKIRNSSPAVSSEFGEQTSLTPLEATEKAKRKQTLRFYTSQIVQKSQKRDNAGRDAGGDTDLPYRERLRDRQARLNAEAQSHGEQTKKKKKKNGKDAAIDGQSALGGASDEEDRRVADELRGCEDKEDYYGLVSARSAAKKAQKAQAAAAASASTHSKDYEEEEVIGPDGKRAISYTIQKNKGLAPKRKKDVRNPRVKKRKKYEEKKKKLGSIRKVYKGGEGPGGYGGEKTGIKSRLIRSVKL